MAFSRCCRRSYSIVVPHSGEREAGVILYDAGFSPDQPNIILLLFGVLQQEKSSVNIKLFENSNRTVFHSGKAQTTINTGKPNRSTEFLSG